MVIYFHAGTVNAGANTVIPFDKAKHQRISWVGFFVELSEWTFEVNKLIEAINEGSTKLTVLTRLILPLDKKIDDTLKFVLSNTGAVNSRYLLLISTERAIPGFVSDIKAGGGGAL